MKHPVLRRQLARLGLDPRTPPGEADAWARFLGRVESAYDAADQERYLLERSFTLSSAEMQELHASLRAREAEQTALRRVATAVASDEAPEAVSDLVAREVAQVVGADAGRVFRFVEDRGHIEGAWGCAPDLGREGAPADGIPLDGATATARVFQTGVPSRVDDYRALDDESARSLASRSFRSGVAAPIRVGGRLWGAVAAMSTTGEALPEFAETAFAEFADLVALAIASSEARTELLARAATDPLTGLPNRRLFDERLEHALRRAHRTGAGAAVLLMDLDRFKEVNDTLGHGAGDALLGLVAKRLTSILRESDTVARLGGDEFAILLPDSSDQPAAIRVAENVRAALDDPFSLSGLRIEIDASLGIALFPAHGVTPEALLQHADVAMYVAKAARTGHAVYSFEHDSHTRERLALAAELRRALDEQELVVVYQPKVRLVGGAAPGVEALVRWQHPTRGLLGPGEFIPMAEHTALIKPLTLYVLDRALAQCRSWADEGLHLGVSVNVSANSLTDVSLPSAVADSLRRRAVAAEQLELEITESALMADPVRSLAVLRDLHELGVRLSIDDFGTGYSSLAHLKDLPIDILKIDRSFVAQMHVSEADAMIVRSTIELAHNLHLETVAEGVERQEHVDALRALGCDTAQGFLLARPMRAEMVEDWIRTRAATGPDPVSHRVVSTRPVRPDAARAATNEA